MSEGNIATLLAGKAVIILIFNRIIKNIEKFGISRWHCASHSLFSSFHLVVKRNHHRHTSSMYDVYIDDVTPRG